MEVLKLFDDISRQEKIDADIKKFRKGEMRIKVVNEKGEPYRNATISLKQRSHEFKFGISLFLLDEMETKEKNERFKQNVSDTFNMGIVPIYWDALEPVRGKPRFSTKSERVYRRPPIDLCIEFCRKFGIEPKAHCLNFDFFTPEWVQTLSAQEHKEALETRMRLLAERYATDIPCWEVINETLIDNGKTPLYYADDVTAWSFDTARKYFSQNELMINENAKNIYPGFAHNRSQYYMQIERELACGTKIDAIGFQAHFMFGEEFRQKYANPIFLDEFFKTYSRFALPLQITEATIPSVFGDVIDEEKQADMLEKMYSYWFSVENMEAIIYWNLTDGYAWQAEPGDMTAGENIWRGGLVDFDGRRKPAYEKLNELIKKTWHTENSGRADCNGEYSASAFFGEYEINVTIDGKTKTFIVDYCKSQKDSNVILTC